MGKWEGASDANIWGFFSVNMIPVVTKALLGMLCNVPFPSSKNVAEGGNNNNNNKLGSKSNGGIVACTKY